MESSEHCSPGKLGVLTLNCALLNLCWLGNTVYRPTPWTETRLEYLIRALSQSKADLIFLQECFHFRQKSTITNSLATHYPYNTLAYDGVFTTRLGTNLLILSRFPLQSATCHRFTKASFEERMFTRLGFLTVDVDLPGTGSTQLVNFHLTAGGLFGHPEDPAMEVIRASQIDQILSHCRLQEPVILAGDLNAGPEVSVDNYNAVLEAGFTDCPATVGMTEYSWHPDNPLVRTGDESHLPEQRIDHVFVNERVLDIWQPASAAITMMDTFKNNRGDEITISDHYGVAVTFEQQSGQS